MTITTAIHILKEHNKWRRGAERPQADPKVIGEAIDKVVKEYEEQFNNKL